MRVRPNWTANKDFAELNSYVYGNKALSQAERKERLQVANQIVDCQTNPKSDGALHITSLNHVTELPVIPANVRELYISNMDRLENPPRIAAPKTGAEPTLKKYTIEYCGAINQTPDIRQQTRLKSLSLNHCKKLTVLPHVGSESRLEYLQMRNCGELQKPAKKFEGKHLEKVLINHRPDLQPDDYLTPKQIRKLDFCDDLPYKMDNPFDVPKTPYQDRNPPEPTPLTTSNTVPEWRRDAQY